MSTHRPAFRLLALLVAALLAGPGCTRHYIVSVDELRKLDGYGLTSGGRRSPGTHAIKPDRELTATDGSVIPFNLSTTLSLLGPEPEVSGKFRSIRLTPTQFEGVLAGIDQPIRVDLAAVQFAKVEVLDPGATFLAAGGAIMGFLTLVYGFLLFSVRAV